MPSCPFVHQSLQSKGQKVPKSGAFKNEGIPEVGGSLFPGDSALKSVKHSKDGDKLTIVLKKKKQKKNADRT